MYKYNAYANSDNTLIFRRLSIRAIAWTVKVLYTAVKILYSPGYTAWSDSGVRLKEFRNTRSTICKNKSFRYICGKFLTIPTNTRE